MKVYTRGSQMREEIISAIEKEKIIVIVRGVEKDKLINLAEAMYVGGIRLLELTYDASGNVSDEEIAENIRMLAERFEGRMYIGAGTVLTERQVEFAKNAGAGFIISPDVYSDVIKKTRELEMVSVPGALTPSEIQKAHRLGADFVKIFPISTLGLEYVKAVKDPLSHIKMLAVGGINADNVEEYIKSGISGIGVGSNIVDKKLIENNDFDKICELAKKYTEVISK